MRNVTHIENTQNTIISRFGFLPALLSQNSIEIYHPFSTLVASHLQNRNLKMSYIESGSIKISYDKMNVEEKEFLLEELRILLEDSRREVIDDFLIYKNKGIKFL